MVKAEVPKTFWDIKSLITELILRISVVLKCMFTVQSNEFKYG